MSACKTTKVEHKSMGGNHRRAESFHEIGTERASGILADVLIESNTFLGGASVGKGFQKAARFYMSERLSKKPRPGHLDLPGSRNLNPDCDTEPLEDSFYVMDLGVVVSQVYQWRRFFPRIEPFYAVKCNPDPVIIKTLATLGCNFDCASRQEIRLVQGLCSDLPRTPDIIYANPCKARAHLIEAVCKGVTMVTVDNVVEVQKCASISKKIELVMRIITDDRGSQCRFSTKFGAPRNKWRPLMAAAKKHGLQMVGVSFHVGSGCRDASKYELALKDAREIFDMAESEFGFKMTILDIGGGFPGETHSIWNPSEEIDTMKSLDLDDSESSKEGTVANEDEGNGRFMFFTEIAEKVAPVIDTLFPPSEGVRVIAEPGRYLVAACGTLCCSVVAARNNALDTKFEPEAVDDIEAAKTLDSLSREEESSLVRMRGESVDMGNQGSILNTIQEELSDYTKLYTSQQLVQQEFDVYNDHLDLYEEGFETARDLLGPPEESQLDTVYHTAEGMSVPLMDAANCESDRSDFLSLAAAGEAAVNGVVLQAVADSTPLQDDFAYYINDGVYGAFNNVMFDHAMIRPRVLLHDEDENPGIKVQLREDGFKKLEEESDDGDAESNDHEMFASTVFGPTCDSIDVIARSVLLPKLDVGDWMYFQNMGAYTMAAASSFNGFAPSEKFYVCSMQPEFFEAMVKGPLSSGSVDAEDEKKYEE